MHRPGVGAGGASMPPLREVRCPQKPAVWVLYGGFLPWAQLIKSLPVGDEVQLQPLAPPPRSDPLIPSKAGFPDNQPRSVPPFGSFLSHWH